MAPTTGPKKLRIDLRTTKAQKAYIERGARVQGQNLSDFVLSSAQEKAEMVLADQNVFVLPRSRWESFVAALDKPVSRKERLARLMSEPSLLDRE